MHAILYRADTLKYDVVKAGTEYAKLLHQYAQSNRKEIQRVYRAQSSIVMEKLEETLDILAPNLDDSEIVSSRDLLNKACFPRSSRMQDYIFMLHGYGNNYGCLVKEFVPDIFMDPWEYYYNDDRSHDSTYTQGFMLMSSWIDKPSQDNTIILN